MSTVESWIEVQIERVLVDAELAEMGSAALAMVTALADRAEQVAALRAAKGKGLSGAAREVLNELGRQADRLERK